MFKDMMESFGNNSNNNNNNEKGGFWYSKVFSFGVQLYVAEKKKLFAAAYDDDTGNVVAFIAAIFIIIVVLVVRFVALKLLLLCSRIGCLKPFFSLFVPLFFPAILVVAAAVMLYLF